MTQQPWGPAAGQQPAQLQPGPPGWSPAQASWGPARPAWGQPAAQAPQPYGVPPAPFQSPPPGREDSPLKLVLLGLIVAVALGFFAFGLASYLNRPGDPSPSQPTESTSPQPEPTTPSPPQPSPTPTAVESTPVATPTPEPTPSPPQPSPTPTAVEPTPAPTPTPEPTPTPTPTDPAYDPPPLPFPVTWVQADEWLVANALYAETVQVPTDCGLDRVDLVTSDIPQIQPHFDHLIDCTMAVWQGPMVRAGFVLPKPPVTIYATPITTACGTLPTRNAYYCALDQRLYFATDFHKVFTSLGVTDVALAAESIMGHEFGHFLQGRSGIWGAFALTAQQAQDEGTALELSRRVEVQADCLSGMFLNSVAEASQVTPDDREGILRLFAAIGDDTLGNPNKPGDHGKGATRHAWIETGLSTAETDRCNTWSVGAEQVR